jgi:hypothetical protein
MSRCVHVSIGAGCAPHFGMVVVLMAARHNVPIISPRMRQNVPTVSINEFLTMARYYPRDMPSHCARRMQPEPNKALTRCDYPIDIASHWR